MTGEPTPRDPADTGADTFVRRNGGWTAAQWLAYLERHPDATLPSGSARCWCSTSGLTRA